MSFLSGLSRPMRAAGVALIGVAVVAAVIGGVTLATSGGSNDTAGPSPSAGPSSPPSTGEPSSSAPVSSSAPSSPSVPPSSSTAPGSSPTAPPGGQTTGQPGQPGQPGSQPGQPGQPGVGQQASNKWVTVRVFNNSLIKHLAEQAADDFRAAGWNVPVVDNYSQGVIDHTTAYFRPGTDEEAAARQLATEFGLQALPRFQGIQDASPGVVVIITKDYQSGHKGS
ncbi:LytR C-terminal domain-containing protein [Amycolatopsis sp. PS_44_ISF1]|uniref:LytR C-terminal domain-containing protein n=1 Tax=Amycolatopsis sp. PS_44_ISF1 TaxID=2974917 RepID=UPI0028E002CF|nr:LytR C-terminal domain-containing protein [Amycolatopsis sp. PS_44_ISF1]MDT8911086.1 LytR C-terminal domain-containing protein [Amycolatopsis sp. PS_44_ISF1]